MSKYSAPVQTITGAAAPIAQGDFLWRRRTKWKTAEKGKEVIDLTSYISPEMLQADVDGSYTGVPRETYYEDIPAEPVQDADDL